MPDSLDISLSGDRDVTRFAGLRMANPFDAE
jgi:hypothetical protein